jgi:cardiolipin synthase A/B
VTPLNQFKDRPDEPAEPQNRTRSLTAHAVFSRAAGAPLHGGNAVRLLLDGSQNYDAWRQAIRSATQTVYFENYIIRPDVIGHTFVADLTDRARAGVKVRVLLDWFGSFSTPRSFWKPLLDAGGRVRYHNPPGFGGQLQWFNRDHRKSLVVDGRIGSVSGVCVSDVWLGNAEKKIEPYRDTGVEIRGPAAADLVSAFADVWAQNGTPIPEEELTALPEPEDEGDVAVRVIATAPNITAVYRLDLLITALAQHRLWLTDAYFAGTSAYVHSLRAAARDGVDVRLLVPGGSDLPWLRPITTAGYRPLLEAGVRVFEWNGSMIHAKSAIADDRWARVGSTNLNVASWLTNFELDVTIEDEGFIQQMSDAYERDLQHSTEIVLKKYRRVRLPRPDDPRGRSRPGRGSIARATAGALRFTRTVSAVVTNQRVLGPADARSLVVAALIALGFAMLAVWFPIVVAWPMAVLAVLLAVMLLARAVRSRMSARRRQADAKTPA